LVQETPFYYGKTNGRTKSEKIYIPICIPSPLSMEKALDNDSIYNLFQLPQSTVAHQELHDLQEEINEITVSNQHDSWVLQGSNRTFSTKRIYIELV
jgi:hypothetical protein